MNEGIDLLQKVQKIIEDQDKEIKDLKRQINKLKATLGHQHAEAGHSSKHQPVVVAATSQHISSVDSNSTPSTIESAVSSASSEHRSSSQHSSDQEESSKSNSPVFGKVLRSQKSSSSRLSIDECKAIVSDSTSLNETPFKQEAEMSVSSSDQSGTEDSSFDSDIPVSFSPDPPAVNVISTLPDTPKVKILNGRRTTSFAAGNITKDNALDEDIDSKDDLPSQPFRKRVQTFGGHGLRKNRTQTPSATNASGKQPVNRVESISTRLQRRNSFPRRGKSNAYYDMNLLSPDMELKIQQMIQLALARKYGGKEKSTRAAIVIQTAYRKYKNVQHFKKLREIQQTTMQRRRTMSVKYPGGRRPSMIKRKQNKSLHDPSSVDKMAHVKTMYRNLTQTKLSPNISRRELLAASGASPIAVHETKHVEITEQQDMTPPPNQLSMIDEMDSDEERSLEPEQPVDDKPRSHSVFSGLSSTAIQKMFSSKHPVIVKQRQSAKTFTKKMVIGANIFNRNPKKGIQYLVFEGILDDSPYAVADFLKSYFAISKEKIGEFVGEIRIDFNMAVLECLVESIDLSGKTIDVAIRDFQKLFRMPGEAQKIDKIMQVFASEYFKHNPESVVKSEDAAYVLSFAIMMLHTDLHNPAVKRHMTKKEWFNMNRGTNDDEDFPMSFLSDIYDRIQRLEFETGKDHTHQVTEIRKKIVGHGVPPMANPQRRFVHQCEVSQVSDMNKRNLRKHRRTLFLFNDVLLVTKQLGPEKFEFKKALTLLNSHAVHFTTQYYKHGVNLQNEISEEKYYCNCDSEGERTRLATRLVDAISELHEMEIERMSDFAYKGKSNARQKQAETVKTESTAGDLISSIKISSSEQNLHLVDERSGQNSTIKAQSSTLKAQSSTLKAQSSTLKKPQPSSSPVPHSHTTDHKRLTVIPTQHDSSTSYKSKTLGNRKKVTTTLANNRLSMSNETLSPKSSKSPSLKSPSKKRAETK